MRKVLWISSVGEKGGAEVYMLNLLKHLDRTRFQPSVALLRPGPLEADLRRIDVPAIHLPAHRMRNVARVGQTIRALAARIRDQEIDLVHSNGFRAHVYGGAAAALARVPALWTVHTAERDGFSTAAILRIPARRVIANCHRTARYFVQKGHTTSLLWPSVDPEALAQITPRETVTDKYRLPKQARWICMGPRLQRYKGHEFFLRALAAFPPEQRDVHGIVMGGTLFGMEPDYPETLKALARELGIHDRLHFTGHIDAAADVYGMIAGSELLAHPALDEDFGLIIAEAQALGRAVIAFSSVGPAEIVVDGETGRLAPIGEQAAFTAALVDALRSPERRRAWGVAGRERALKRYGVSAAVRQLERIYESEVEPHGTAPVGARAATACPGLMMHQ